MKPCNFMVMVSFLLACAAGVPAGGEAAAAAGAAARGEAAAAAGGGATTRPSSGAEPGTSVQGVFGGISGHLGTPGVAGGSVIVGRRTHTVGAMGESWTGVGVGGTGGKKGYGYALLDAGYVGLASAKAGVGYYRDRDDDEGAQLELGLGIMAGFVYGRLRSSARSHERHFEAGLMVILPVCEC